MRAGAHFALALAAAAGACGPRVDPQGPGALPDPIEGSTTTPVATRAPEPTAPASHPAAEPARPPTTPLPPASPPDAPEAPAETTPPHAALVLAPAKGSTVEAKLILVQLEEGTRLLGSISGLAKNTGYVLSKRDHCLVVKADDDSRRSNPVVYGIAFKANGNGFGTVDDVAKAIHLDGPMSVVGAVFVISRTAGGKELACGRVVEP